MRSSQSDVRRRRDSGFTLLTTVLCLVVMLGALGLALDLGRMYVVKNELQAYSDSAALAAALELDGTAAGLQRAESVGLTGTGANPNRWNFGSRTVSDIQVRFSNSSTGGWQPRGSIGSPLGYRFVRVRAAGSLGMAVMPVLGVAGSQEVAAVAFAGQGQQSACGGNCDPFAPIAPNQAAPNFGFTAGQLYTLKWAPPGHRDPGTAGFCPGDTSTPVPGSSERGYIDLGQGNGNSALADAILNHDYAPGIELNVGDTIDPVNGNKSVGSDTGALGQRIAQDTDSVSTRWSEYATSATGNGRRLLHVPVQNIGGTVIGFATFFMQTAPRGVCGGNSDACCAEFVGIGGVDSSRWGAAGTDETKLYRVKLFAGGL